MTGRTGSPVTNISIVVDFVIVGPSTDHLGSPYSYYLYIEVSGRHGGEKARILTTPRFQGK